MHTSRWWTRLDVAWLQVKSANGEDREGESLWNDVHWKVRPKFEEDSNNDKNRTAEQLELLRNGRNLYGLHVFVRFKCRGRE